MDTSGGFLPGYSEGPPGATTPWGWLGPGNKRLPYGVDSSETGSGRCA
jgi:hypothetical protein